MKKNYSLIAAALLLGGVSVNAQTDLLNLPNSAAEAEAAGCGQMWNSYEWGASLPAKELFSNADVKLTLCSEALVTYNGGSKAGKNVYGGTLCMSSTAGNWVTDPVYDPAALAVTKSGKQGGALKLEPTVDGKITLYYSSGFNNRSMFVYDMTESINEGMGALILANNIEQGADKGDQMKADGVKDKVHTPTFDVAAGHTYYIFGSSTQQELYRVVFTSFKDDAYTSALAADNGHDALLLTLPNNAAEAEAAGCGQMWNSYEWGALMPAKELFSNSDVKLSSCSDALVTYNGGSKAGKNIYAGTLCMSSSAGNWVTDAVYDPTSLAVTNSGKQGGALKLEPTVDGKITLYYSSGFNNRSMFVYDMTESINEGMGALILANNIEQGADKGDQMKADGVKDKVHTPTFDVAAGHTYYIFGSSTQQELYQIGWNSFMTENYNSTTGINEIQNTNAVKANNRIYSIDGKFVGTDVTVLSNGIYVQNGKKFVK